jgi:imidazolonepropionase-like amidohydrolase
MLPRLRDTIVRAHRMGVKIVAGGTGYGPNSLTRISQSHPFRRDGPPLQALQSATLVTAGCCGWRHRSRSTRYDADLIAVEQKSLVTIAAILDPLLVISNGRIGLDRLNFGRGTSPDNVPV